MSRTIAANLQDTASTVQSTWEASPQPMFERLPKIIPAPETASAARNAKVTSDPRMVMQATLNQEDTMFTNHNQVARSDSSSVSDVSYGAPVQSGETTLSVRGKGHHVCPHGASCTKGGLAADGRLVIFERNSAFRYVFLISQSLTSLDDFLGHDT